MAWTAKIFSQPLSSLLEIGDWSVAREIDIKAAAYLHEEEIKREVEREQRDREFWVAMLDGKSHDGGTIEESGEARLGTR